MTELENAEFSYDYATDPSYQAYLNAFTRQGNSAAEAAMAQSAANTGGVASSYAAAVANQMQQAYAQKAADMIPQLEQQAYERYANDISNRFNLANLYGSLDQNDYSGLPTTKTSTSTSGKPITTTPINKTTTTYTLTGFANSWKRRWQIPAPNGIGRAKKTSWIVNYKNILLH